MAGLGAQILGRVLRVVGVVLTSDLRLVGQDEMLPKASKLVRHRRDVVVADQMFLSSSFTSS